MQSSSGDIDVENRLMDMAWAVGRKERVGWTERITWKHITMCEIDSQWEFAI